MNVAVATRMPVEELTFALAVHCGVSDENPKGARKHLDVTPRAHFDEALVWTKSNASVVERIRSEPDAIAAGGYTLSPARSWLSRLLGFGRARPPADDELERVAKEVEAKRRPIDAARAKSRAELRALVDDAFDGP